MSLYKTNKTDASKESSGVPLEFGVNSKGDEITFMIAREGGRNSEYLKYAEQVFKPYRRQIQHNKISPQILEELLAKIYAKTVVKGWTGVEDENDNPLAFTEDNVYKILTDLPVVFDAIKEVARDYVQYIAEDIEADAKN